MLEKTLSKLEVLFIPCEANLYRPRILDGKFLYYYAITLLVLKLFTIPFLLYLPRTIFFADVTESVLINLTNQQRESLGLSNLEENPKLKTAALLKAQDIIEKDYFAHQSPAGVSFWQWFKEANYNYEVAGENLAIGFLDSEEVHRAWLDSYLHRLNILNPKYKDMGIAVLKGNFQGNETTVVVQLFGAPQDVSGAQEAQAQILSPEEIPSEELVEKEALPEEELKETSVEEEILTQTQTQSTKDNFLLRLSYFISLYYPELIQQVIYISLMLLIVYLLVIISLDVFVYNGLSIQHRDLVYKAIGFSVLMATFLFIDKETMIRFIPHNFNIY